MNPPTIAIILPCYNEEDVLPETFARITEILSNCIKEGLASEKSCAYYVNDGSSDRTWQLIADKAAEDKMIRGISLSRNFGHQNALLAGLRTIDADAYITIDADLQDDPACIREMLVKFSHGTEIVCGVRGSREKDSFFKKHTALLYYRIMREFGTELIPNHADFRLMGKKSVCVLRQFREKKIFLRGLISCMGFKTECVYYPREARQSGETKYTIAKMLDLAISGLAGFTDFPIRAMMAMGLVFSIFGIFGIILYMLNIVSLFCGMIAIMSFFSGINLFAVGLVAEYVYIAMTEAKDRPSYIIEKTTYGEKDI